MVVAGSCCTILCGVFLPVMAARPEGDGFLLTAINDSAAPVSLAVRAVALSCDGQSRDLGQASLDIDRCGDAGAGPGR